MRLLLALCVCGVAVALAHAAPIQPLAYVPANCAIYFHADVAALYDGKLKQGIAGAKDSPEVGQMLKSIEALSGLPAGEVQSFTYIAPDFFANQNGSQPLSIVVARKAIDQKVMQKELVGPQPSKSFKREVKAGSIVFTPGEGSQGLTKITYGFVGDNAMFIYGENCEALLTPAKTDRGIHTAKLATQAKAHLAMGFNFGMILDDLKAEKSLPSETAFLLPIMKAEGGWLTGTLDKDALKVDLQLKGSSKANAEAATEALDAGRTMINLGLSAMNKRIIKDMEQSAPMIAWLDNTAKAMKEMKFKQDDVNVTGSMTIPMKDSLAPMIVLFANGGADQPAIRNNLKQLGLAMHNHDFASGHLPDPATIGEKQNFMLSWRVTILPYIDQNELYKQFKLDEPWDSKHNLKVLKDNPMPDVFAVPDSKNADDKKTHFQVFVSNGALFSHEATTRLVGASDGTSNTIMIAMAEKAVEWTKPDDITYDTNADMTKLLWYTKLGVTFANFADGSVRRFNRTMKPATLHAWITKSGGEVIANDDDDE